MGAFSLSHLIILLVVVVLVFGTKKLKNMGSDLGSAVKGFKDGMRDGSAPEGDGTAAPTQQVTNAPGASDKSTIDVEARNKS